MIRGFFLTNAMKFVDEAVIQVRAGNGGDGCLSFRREKYIARGGPDGGDGGDGGSVYLQADQGLNTMVDYRYKRRHQAGSGRSGRGKNMTGASGADLFLKVPVGTTVLDEDTGEVLGDLSRHEEMLLVARGGFHGMGNTRFKSSANRAPRQTTEGGEGEQRTLKLELQVLADVGLLGLPNAGKSTLIRAISAARPKVADYPFTTLIPNLGVVAVQAHRSFVVADIPGLIENASEGAGLGIHFLRHLTRNRLLLHLVDVAPADGTEPEDCASIIVNELARFSPALARRERWLVLNKTDLLDETSLRETRAAIVERLQWQGPCYEICALSGAGTGRLCADIMTQLETWQEREQTDPELAGLERAQRELIQTQARERIAELQHRRGQAGRNIADTAENGDGVEVKYVP